MARIKRECIFWVYCNQIKARYVCRAILGRSQDYMDMLAHGFMEFGYMGMETCIRP